MFHLTGIFLSLFLSFLLFTKKGKSAADQVLAMWLLIISFHLLCYYLLISGEYQEFPYLLGLEIPLPLVHGPFLYLYTTQLTHQDKQKVPVQIHFVPAALAFILLSGFYMLSAGEKIYIYNNHGIGYEKLTAAIRMPIIPSGLLYIALSLLLLKKHRSNISGQFSCSDKINLNWLFYLTIGITAIWLSIIFGNDMSTFAFVDLFVLFIGYFGIRQVGVFADNKPFFTSVSPRQHSQETEKQNVEAETASKEIIKYGKTALSKEQMFEMHRRLTLLMQNTKPFKDPELTLGQLAVQLGVAENTLSQIINVMEQRNFYDYINNLRVQEFKQIALHPDNKKFTLLSLAFEVGFNSKTSFNRNFKKSTGLSPRAFCQQQKVSTTP